MTTFLLSPARCDGRRTQVLMNPGATFPMAVQLREAGGAPIGDVFSFLSGLYFRGKMEYAMKFGARTTYVITTDRGLVTPDVKIRPADIEAFARVDLSKAGDEFLRPFTAAAERLAGEMNDSDPIVLLGSVASPKYVDPLVRIFGERLLFPREFVGRGDMSRGGLLLRHVAAGREMDYVPVATAVRHGKRPPKLDPIRKPR